MAWFQEGQLQNLVMSGLGILHDSPPTSLQPPLVDGVHLRWAFRPDRGFPWFGYYLFRRLQRPETRLTRDKLIPFPYLVFPGSLGTAIRETPYGWLTSDLDIALSDKFVPEAPNGGWVAGVVNFELEDRQLLRFTLKPGLLAQGAETMISFKHARQRIGFFNVGVGPNPRIEQGVSFTVKDSNSTEVYTLPPYTGLDCGQELDIDLPFPCSWVKVELATFAPPAYVTALDQDGKVVQHKQTTWPNGQAGGLTLHRDPITGNTITRVIIAGPENILYQFSYRKAVTPQEGEVQVRALLGNTPVDQATATGTDGVSVNLSLHADAISGIEFGPGPAVVSNLTLLMPYANFAEGWERLADFPYPMRLPVTHPSYPCTQNAPENLADARALARQRIRYGNPDDWVLPQTPTTTAGTVSVSSDSPGVLGTGTDWSDDLVGQVFQVAGDPTAYTILSVIASGKLVLSRPYAGLSRDGAAYAIREDPFGQLHDSLVHLVAEPAKGAMFGRALPVTFSGLGTLSVTQGSPIVTLKGATWPLELAGFGLQICGEPAGKAYATEGSSVVTGKQTS
jgi:hypothetical protein